MKVFFIITSCFTFFDFCISTLLQIKAWSELSCCLKLYFCFTIPSLLVLLGITLTSIYKQHMGTEVTDEDNFTVSLIQLVGICKYHHSISRNSHLLSFSSGSWFHTTPVYQQMTLIAQIFLKQSYDENFGGD